MQTITMRGAKLDMGKLVAQNSHKRALGNANMNARGDILGEDGQVKVTRENIAREYHKTNPKAVKQVPLRSISNEVVNFNTPAEAMAKQKEQAAQQQKSKRKIIEND